MISLEDAIAAYSREIQVLPPEKLPIVEALNRVLATNVIAVADLPRMDQSAVDGYAVLSADLQLASKEQPVKLRVSGTSAPGANAESVSVPGTTVRILTGAAVPALMDAVLPQEDVSRETDTVVFKTPVGLQRNIRYQGEEIRVGAVVAEAGTRVSSGLLGSLISAGLHELSVHRSPRITVIVTGDELRPAGTPLLSGEIPDSNGPMVKAVLTQWGLRGITLLRIGDERSKVEAAMSRALDQSDLVITTGGASVGDRDFIVASAEALGVRRIFWKVAQKPGKPIFFGTRDLDGRQVALLGLPGNPGAVLSGLAIHGRCLVDALEGARTAGPIWRFGELACDIDRDQRRARLIRMKVFNDPLGKVLLKALPGQESHMLSNLSHAEALVWIPSADHAMPAGTVVRWTELPR